MRTALRLSLAFVVACVACSSPSTAPAASAAPSPTAPATSATAFVTPTSAATSTPATSPFLRIALTDVRTGERFTLGGFPGKTVIVEGMAVW